MSGFNPYFTNDGSVGLYNEDFDDIYHSAQGALTEAYEKFIYPSNIINILNNDTIKVLDICFGIGYNTKSFLNSIIKIKKFEKNFLKNFSLPNCSIESIHTNNIIKTFVNNLLSDKNTYIDKRYTDKILQKIYIKAIDTDKNLALLSPFIKTGKKFFKNKDLAFYDKISKYFTQKPVVTCKIDNSINFLLLLQIYNNNPEYCADKTLNLILENNDFEPYFEPEMVGLFKAFKYKNSINNKYLTKITNLHNIYYKYISSCYKKRLKSYNLLDIDFNLKISDARKELLSDKNTYDLIFLDAFSPNKCPCLWTYDFFKELYKHLNSDGMLLSYSTSAPVRSAMQESGFYIGNSFNKRLNKNCGTVAVKNPELIKHPLSEFDLGLLKTKAGIFYRDENLTEQNEAIIRRRNSEVKLSERISSTSYINSKKNH